MYGYIYLTTNKINNKKYIGQHRANHFEPNKYKGSGILLVEAFNKYGFNNFDCDLLEECSSEEELNEREKYWISYYNAVTDDTFYNIASGGEGHTCEPWNKGKHQELHPNAAKALEYGRHLPASPKLKSILSNYRKKCSSFTRNERETF